MAAEMQAAPQVSRPQGERCDVGSYEYVEPAGPTFTIDALGDESDASPADGLCQTAAGTCTLRAAAEEIQSLDAPPSKIVAGIDGTITLGAPIVLTKRTTISGKGRTLTISGVGATSIFDLGPTGAVLGQNETDYTVEHLTLADGHTDDARGGAALYSTAAVTVDTVTFIHNTSTAAPGRAVVSAAGWIDLKTTTFWENSAPSGSDVADVADGFSVITASTLVRGAHGSVSGHGASSTMVIGSIVDPADGPACEGSQRGAFLLAHDDSCADQISGDARVGLGTLARRGGSVPTVNITSDSPAIDRVWNSAYCPAKDARGVARPQGDACDVGAYEFSGAPNAIVTMTSSPVAPTLGQDVQVTATVTSPDETWTPVGSVRFFSADGDLATVPLDAAGQATTTVSSLPVGTHLISGIYDETADLLGAQSEVEVTIGKAATTVSLGAAPNPSAHGEEVVLSASVNVIAPGTGVATGAVHFFDGTTELGVATLDGTGAATFRTTALAAGTHVLAARYDGDSDRSGATSPEVAQVVGAAGANVALSASTDRSTFG